MKKHNYNIQHDSSIEISHGSPLSQRKNIPGCPHHLRPCQLHQAPAPAAGRAQRGDEAGGSEGIDVRPRSPVLASQGKQMGQLTAWKWKMDGTNGCKWSVGIFKRWI